MPAIQVNVFAVLVAALAAFLLGGLWYSPLLFASKWVNLHGYSEEQVKQMQKSAGPSYAAAFACNLIMALAISVIFSYTGLTTVAQGVWLGFLLWLGFVGTTGLTNTMFSNRPIGLFVLDGSYQLVYMIIMSVILAAWR